MRGNFRQEYKTTLNQLTFTFEYMYITLMIHTRKTKAKRPIVSELNINGTCTIMTG